MSDSAVDIWSNGDDGQSNDLGAMTAEAWDSETTRPEPLLIRRLAADIAGLGSSLAIALGVLWLNLVSHYDLFRLDILTFYLPWYEYLGSRLRTFDIPGWLPYTMSGVPFAGDPQSGWGYLPAMICFAIAPSTTGYVIFLTFHMALAAVGSYLFARVIGMRPIAATMTSVAFTLGNLTERVACCTIHVQVAVWIPAIFLCIELALRATTWQRRIFWFVLAGFAAGQMMAGWIGQGAYYGGLAVGAYLLVRMPVIADRSWNVTLRIRQFAIAALVIGISAAFTVGPAVLPRLDTISRSNLSDLYRTSDEGAEPGWTLSEYPSHAFSFADGTGTTYLGIVLLAVAVAGAIAAWRRPRVRYFAIFGLVVLLLVLQDSPVDRLFNLLPRFESLHDHSPDRIFIILYVAPAVLAGWLVERVVSRNAREDRGWSRSVAAIVLAVGALTWVLVEVHRADGFWVRRDRIELGVAALLLIAVGLLARPRWIGYTCALLLIGLVAYDPSYDRAFDRLRRESTTDRYAEIESDYTTPSAATLWLQQQRDAGEYFRFIGYDQAKLMEDGEPRTYHIDYSNPATTRLLVNNRGIAFHLQDAQGYNPVQIQRYVDYFDAINGVEQSYHAANVLASGLDSPLLRLLGVHYVVVPLEIPPGRPDLLRLSQRFPTVHRDGRVRILALPDPLPRAWLVHDADQLETGEDILTRLSLQLDDPARTVLLTDEEPDLKRPQAGAQESVTITSYQADEIHLQVTAASAGMVVLSEIWDPGWSATVDGDAAKVYAADYVLRGVVVGPGTHEVVLRYKASLAKWSLLLWLAPLGALLGLGVSRGRWHDITGPASPAGGGYSTPLAE